MSSEETAGTAHPPPPQQQQQQSPPSAATSNDARVRIVGDLPPKVTLPADKPTGGEHDDDDDDDSDDDDDTHHRDDEEEDPQTEEDEPPQQQPATGAAGPAGSGPQSQTVQYGAVTVQTGGPANGQLDALPSRDEIPDDSELLASYPDTEEILDLSHLRISSTRNLGLPRFQRSARRLCLRQNEIAKMRSKDIGVLTELRDLDLYDNSIERISGLDRLDKLESLDLSFNNIHHISNVSHLGSCKTLYFVQNKISKVRPDDLQGPIAQSLTSLELGGNRLRSIDNLGHLHALTELWLGKNKITSLRGLETLVNLRILSIQSNRITRIEGLDSLVNLEQFYISHNGLTRIEGLDHNRNLTTLDVSGNQIEVVENVAHLAELEEFWANDNKIKDLNNLESQLGPKLMPKLETVYLEGNPVQRTEGPAYRRKIKLLLPQLSQIDAS
ncbi:probable SDS22 - protein phosphatase 1, regulatory subunit 7 [Pseudozyma flocculosa]|uniref:Probable SDS22 - protein phosphatase 1, regulatory subunit 7 n=2 Tax=Pseudozyma flocculosa TaxID=84751 RepID=A0A5C3FBT8_9BASI|nr:probable SDS22 - protein phosphatase 1, regulatory subunit 7 [Pseudozyma flocculosa]